MGRGLSLSPCPPPGDSCSLRPLSHIPPPPATLWHPHFWDLCWAHPKNHPGGIQKDPRVGPDSPHLPPAMPLSFPGVKGSIQQPPNFEGLLGHPPALKGGWTQGKGRLGSRWKPAAPAPGASQAGGDFSARFNPSWQVPGGLSRAGDAAWMCTTTTSKCISFLEPRGEAGGIGAAQENACAHPLSPTRVPNSPRSFLFTPFLNTDAFTSREPSWQEVVVLLKSSCFLAKVRPALSPPNLWGSPATGDTSSPFLFSSEQGPGLTWGCAALGRLSQGMAAGGGSEATRTPEAGSCLPLAKSSCGAQLRAGLRTQPGGRTSVFIRC